MRFVIFLCLFVSLLTLCEAKKSKKDWRKWKTLLSPVEDVNSQQRPEWKDLQEHNGRKIKNKKHDLCQNVKCGHSKRCQVVENEAVCISQHKVKIGQKKHSKLKKGTKKDCPKCPVLHPYFVCGSDGITYADQCNLDRQACITGKKITKQCDGRCPCKGIEDGDVYYEDTALHYDYVQFEDPQISKEDLLMNDVLPGGNAVDAPVQAPEPLLNEDTLAIDCTSDELKDLPTRLVEWFGLLKEDEDDLYKKNPHKAKPRPAVEVLPKCKESTAWMFTNLDLDRNMALTTAEYRMLYDDQYEICMVPFLDSCDANLDMQITAAEWCDCFHSVDDKPPCYSELEDVPTMLVMGEVRPLPGAYVPACDETGYYAKVQCHGSTGYCWCVDKYGTEYEATRVRGTPPCDEIFDDTETEGVTEDGSGLK